MQQSVGTKSCGRKKQPVRLVSSYRSGVCTGHCEDANQWVLPTPGTWETLSQLGVVVCL